MTRISRLSAASISSLTKSPGLSRRRRPRASVACNQSVPIMQMKASGDATARSNGFPEVDPRLDCVDVHEDVLGPESLRESVVEPAGVT
jgi:hypothetical protein